MRKATRANLAKACRTCQATEGRACKPGGRAWTWSGSNWIGRVHGSRARMAHFA